MDQRAAVKGPGTEFPHLLGFQVDLLADQKLGIDAMVEFASKQTDETDEIWMSGTGQQVSYRQEIFLGRAGELASF